MSTKSEFTGESIVHGGLPAAAALITAEGILAAVGRDHLLVLPLAQKGGPWVDFSTLDFFLPELIAATRLPKLPIDISPLVEVCRAHPDAVNEVGIWEYRFFYLELLANEKVLTPLFWAPAWLPLRLRLPEAPRPDASASEDCTVGSTQRCQLAWEKHADSWIEEGIIEADDGRPWLSYLCYREPYVIDSKVYNGVRAPGSLDFDKLPFYQEPDAHKTVLRAMKRELWRTSIFCPTPLPNRTGKEFHAACDRFGLRHRRATQQQIGKGHFEWFVHEQWENEVPKKAIGREAVQRGLWPHGTRKSNCEPTHDDDVENCRRAVIRLINTREEYWLKEQAQLVQGSWE